jgi:phosphoribosylaminoimidazole-succinocarboxamide synthase
MNEAMNEPLMSTQLGLPNRRSGKVRDLYDAPLPDGDTGVLIVATDRISAFDVVMANGVPGKGIVLTQMARFWFARLATGVPHHLVSTDVNDVPGLTDDERRALNGRVMLCRRAQVIPIECVARGYLAGTAWKDYQRTGAISGVVLPAGLRNGDRLETPVFTPSTKAETGHDENITFDEASDLIGVDLLEWLRENTLDLYVRAADYARERGIILADTKFEFGTREGEPQPCLIDEIFTPDSSRFWPADAWRPGGEQPSFDKQYLREYLESQVAVGRWNRQAPGPMLPEDVVSSTLARYCEAFHRLTGTPIDFGAFS